MTQVEISLLITIYKGSEVAWFNECLESVHCQKQYISEIVLVEDGGLSPELDAAARGWQARWPIIRRLPLPQNLGPGGASQQGLRHCRYEWVARLDADDIATPERFQHQVEFLRQHPEVDVLGGYMPEFKQTKEQSFAVNYVPLRHRDIAKRISLRSPMVNSSSLFKRDLALAAGGYEELMSHEDHLLWMAMLKKGAVFANLPRIVGYYRASPEYYKRRRGWQVISTELVFQRIALRRGYISHYQFARNLLLRIPPRFLPGKLLEIFYNLFLRSKYKYRDS